MQYDAKGRAFEVSIRVFTDDLEKALSQDNGGRKISHDGNDALIEKYLRKHFALTLGNTARPWQYVGHETEADAQWIYVELPHNGPLQNVALRQSVLLDLFDDQVNLVNLQVGPQKKTLVFRKGQPVQPVTFN